MRREPSCSAIASQQCRDVEQQLQRRLQRRDRASQITTLRTRINEARAALGAAAVCRGDRYFVLHTKNNFTVVASMSSASPYGSKSRTSIGTIPAASSSRVISRSL
jgi:hypothetical protein